MIQVSKPARPPAPEVPVSRRPSFSTVIWTLRRHQGAHVADQPAVGAQDLDHPPLAGQRGHHLHDPRVAGAGEGVDLLQQGDLVGEVGRGQRIVFAIELGVGGARALGGDAGIAALGQGRGLGGPADRGLGDLAGVGVAGGLAGHHPQAEALGGVIGRRLQPAVVEDEGFALRPLDEQLAVVGARQGLAQDRRRPGPGSTPEASRIEGAGAWAFMEACRLAPALR